MRYIKKDISINSVTLHITCHLSLCCSAICLGELYSMFTGLNNIPTQIHVKLEPVNMTLVGNKVFTCM